MFVMASKEKVDIPEQVKCPICFEIPPGEIYQCKNGHSVCAACCSNLHQCPVCRISYSDGRIRNRTLESLLDSMNVEISCPNLEFGCQQKVSRNDIQEHTSICRFNPNRVNFCELLGLKCDFLTNTSSTKQAIKHFLDKHDFIIREGSRAVLNLTLFKSTANVFPSGGEVVWVCGGSTKKMWTPFILDLERSYSGHKNGPTFLLLICLHPEDKSFSCACVYMNGKETIDEFKKCLVEFVIENRSSEKGRKPLQWTIPVVNMLDSNVSLRTIPFRIPVSLLLKHYTGKDGSLQIGVKIILSKRYLQDSDSDSSDDESLLESVSNSTYLVPLPCEVSNNSPSRSGSLGPTLSSSFSEENPGTIEVPYQLPIVMEGDKVCRIHSITAMRIYGGKSFEELRLEDYFLYFQGKWAARNS